MARPITGSGNVPDLLEHDRRVRITQRVAGGRALETDGRNDVAGDDRVDVLAVVGVHHQQAADALLAVLGRIDQTGTGFDRARVHAPGR